MVPKPRMTSPRAQRMAVMVAMTGVFAVTMGLAYLTAAVGGVPGPNDFASPQVVSLEGLRVTVPGEWEEDPAAAREFALERGLVLRDPQRPRRWLLVTTTRHPRPVSLQEQMVGYFRALLGAEFERLLEPLMPQRAVRRDGLMTLESVGLSPAMRGPGRQLHLLMMVTVDGTQHWMIYVTDRLEPGESLTAALQRNMSLFRRIGYTAELEQPGTNP